MQNNKLLQSMDIRWDIYFLVAMIWLITDPRIEKIINNSEK